MRELKSIDKAVENNLNIIFVNQNSYEKLVVEKFAEDLCIAKNFSIDYCYHSRWNKYKLLSEMTYENIVTCCVSLYANYLRFGQCDRPRIEDIVYGWSNTLTLQIKALDDFRLFIGNLGKDALIRNQTTTKHINFRDSFAHVVINTLQGLYLYLMAFIKGKNPLNIYIESREPSIEPMEIDTNTEPIIETYIEPCNENLFHIIQPERNIIDEIFLEDWRTMAMIFTQYKKITDNLFDIATRNGIAKLEHKNKYNILEEKFNKFASATCYQSILCLCINIGICTFKNLGSDDLSEISTIYNVIQNSFTNMVHSLNEFQKLIDALGNKLLEINGIAVQQEKYNYDNHSCVLINIIYELYWRLMAFTKATDQKQKMVWFDYHGRN
ncbi:uncharacterized protein TRIADDRAFT_60394 [Trichoplax adhaerens]|uniref:Uncharacterized protein n=1 Tax=Trichoplax adhaerens TaxID=10228 RepID=B3S838_TRIAD|nr:predicted protein [Trichoplax adhaerens]EDV21129.1 predicted protein [Trichoplax adhaerens]|eukprot:XP_002116459.1 predicted protein [Trichoplax adhaerens]